jgi:D-3-phosphoglycerate dehydrogenase
LALLSDAHVNIVDMLNKSRDEIAYNLIDLNGNVDDALLAKIADLDGVVNVRVIR